MMILEFDKAGAEWVVVAYLSGDARMIDVIETGKRPHAITGSTMTGVPEDIVLAEDKILGKVTDPDHLKAMRQKHFPQLIKLEEDKKLRFLPRSMTVYQCGKKCNHGLNYREGVGVFALTNEISEVEAKPMVESYSTTVYPGVQLWWNSIDDQLRKDRILTNCFGRKVKLLDEWGKQLQNKATAFVPQSTVGDVVITAMTKAYEDTSPAFQDMDLLTQTYDSVTAQYPTDDWTLMAKFAIKMGLDYLSPELEYNHRKFKIRTDLKVGLDWGNMVEVKLVNDVKVLAKVLKDTYSELLPKKASGRRKAA